MLLCVGGTGDWIFWMEPGFCYKAARVATGLTEEELREFTGKGTYVCAHLGFCTTLVPDGNEFKYIQVTGTC